MNKFELFIGFFAFALIVPAFLAQDVSVCAAAGGKSILNCMLMNGGLLLTVYFAGVFIGAVGCQLFGEKVVV